MTAVDVEVVAAWFGTDEGRGAVFRTLADRGLPATLADDVRQDVLVDVLAYAGSIDNPIGFAAKALIHPSHVEVVRQAYRPSAEQIDWANRVLAAAENELGVFAFEGKMVDEPVLRQARAIVARTN